MMSQHIEQIPNVTSDWTIARVKQTLRDTSALMNGRECELKKDGKTMKDDKTLADYGITNGLHLPLIAVLKIRAGGVYSVNDWTPLYHECMVCVEKNVNNLSKGYWYHPGGDKAYFTSSKPSKGYIVEVKGNQIRCDGCRKECNIKDWQFKCNNHDYQKIQ